MATFTWADVQTALDAAKTAVLAEDFDTAESQLLAAEVLMAGLPIEMRHGPESVRYREASTATELIRKAITRLKPGTGEVKRASFENFRE